MRAWWIPVASAGVVSALVGVFENVHDQVLAQASILIVVIAIIMTLGAFLGRERSMPLLCDPFLLLFLFLGQFYVFGPFAALTRDIFTVPFMYKYAPERAIEALLAFLVFVVAAIIGNKLRIGRLIGSSLPDFRRTTRRLSGQWLEAATIFGAIAGCFGWIVFNGGLSEKMSQGYGQWRTGGALFRIAFVALQSGTLLLSWRVFSTRFPSLWSRLLLTGTVVFQVLFFGFLIGTRKYLLFLFFGMLTIWLLRRGTEALPRIRIAVLLVLLLGFFSFWGTIRNRPLADLLEGKSASVYTKTGPAEQGYLDGVGGPFAVACLVYELFPEHEPFRYGRTLLVTVLGFIPRAVWPGKPIGIGKEITRYIVGPFYDPVYGFSVTVTLPADLYLNFGWIGLLAGGLLAGVVCRVVATYALVGVQDGLQRVASRAILPGAFIMGLGEVRSDMSVILATYTLTFIPLLVGFTFFTIDLPEDEAR